MSKSIEQIIVKAKAKEGHRVLTKVEKVALESDWLTTQIKGGAVCRCGRKEMLTLDHIIPQSIIESFGFDALREYMPENYQVLCRPCNSLKAGKLDFGNPKTKELLLKFLQKV